MAVAELAGRERVMGESVGIGVGSAQDGSTSLEWREIGPRVSGIAAIAELDLGQQGPAWIATA